MEPPHSPFCTALLTIFVIRLISISVISSENCFRNIRRNQKHSRYPIFSRNTEVTQRFEPHKQVSPGNPSQNYYLPSRADNKGKSTLEDVHNHDKYDWIWPDKCLKLHRNGASLAICTASATIQVVYILTSVIGSMESFPHNITFENDKSIWRQDWSHSLGDRTYSSFLMVKIAVEEVNFK